MKTIWLLFDLSNGEQEGTSGYVWWFNSKRKALNHKKHHEEMKYSARLGKPTKATIEEK